MGERTASCGCGNIRLTTTGEPLQVYACSCLNCQRETGSVFSYSAVFPQAQVSIAGTRSFWRREGDSGRWIETEFCPACGTTVLCRMESWPGVIAVSAGCFADPGFGPPETLYWAARHHDWLSLPRETERIDRQPG